MRHFVLSWGRKKLNASIDSSKYFTNTDSTLAVVGSSSKMRRAVAWIALLTVLHSVWRDCTVHNRSVVAWLLPSKASWGGVPQSDHFRRVVPGVCQSFPGKRAGRKMSRQQEEDMKTFGSLNTVGLYRNKWIVDRPSFKNASELSGKRIVSDNLKIQ